MFALGKKPTGLSAANDNSRPGMRTLPLQVYDGVFGEVYVAYTFKEGAFVSVFPFCARGYWIIPGTYKEGWEKAVFAHNEAVWATR